MSHLIWICAVCNYNYFHFNGSKMCKNVKLTSEDKSIIISAQTKSFSLSNRTSLPISEYNSPKTEFLPNFGTFPDNDSLIEVSQKQKV